MDYSPSEARPRVPATSTGRSDTSALVKGLRWLRLHTAQLAITDDPFKSQLNATAGLYMYRSRDSHMCAPFCYVSTLALINCASVCCTWGGGDRMTCLCG